ncbi:MAG: peptidase [Flavobacteriaceae bacterium]
MTYCVGLLLKDGLVMVADTRTNAGLDNVATFRKLHIFERPGDRFIALATAGNLAITQSVLSLISEGLEVEATGELRTIWTVTGMFQAAHLVGQAIREVYRIDGPSLEQQSARFDVTMLLGGQVGRGQLRLFEVYAAGNFIEATVDTPYLQIGEHKYGKPILDRAAQFDTDISDGLKLALISMDSTMRSNLGVGMPIDIATYERDALKSSLNYRITRDEPYFADLRNRWSEALRQAHLAIPRPPYGEPAKPSDAD